jgi:hypothetical protein
MKTVCDLTNAVDDGSRFDFSIDSLTFCMSDYVSTSPSETRLAKHENSDNDIGLHEYKSLLQCS